MWLIWLAVAALVLWLIIVPYTIHHDNLIAFTGGLGSGKTFMSVNTALVLYRKQRFRARLENLRRWIKNRFRKPENREEYKGLPELYCNIPVRINRKKMALRLRKEHLLLQERIVEGSVVLLDEVDCFANQFSYNNPCIVDQTGKGGDDVGNFDEFCRFYRHYTKGGYLIFNTQATANENLTIRRRQNQCNILFHFRKWGIPLIFPNILYTVRVRNVTMSDDVRTVEEGNTEDNMRLLIGFMPFYRHYDTYCYSGRYDGVPKGNDTRFSKLKTNECLKAPTGKQKKFTLDKDEEVCYNKTNAVNSVALHAPQPRGEHNVNA